MGFFEIFKKKGIKKNKNDEVSDKPLPTHGWDAITTAFEKLYPGQKNPFHRAHWYIVCMICRIMLLPMMV